MVLSRESGINSMWFDRLQSCFGFFCLAKANSHNNESSPQSFYANFQEEKGVCVIIARVTYAVSTLHIVRKNRFVRVKVS